MTKSYFLGIDGGATKTHCVVCDQSLKVLGSGLAEGSNHHIIGLTDAAANIMSAVTDALQEAGLALSDIMAAGFGMAGVDAPLDRELLEGALRAYDLPQCLVLTNDGMAALSGATGGEPGVVAIAGTGAIAVGMNEVGETARAGGWGYILGDEGSAYDIGRRGMVAALWAYDGRGPQTVLLDRLMEAFHLQTIRDLIELVYEQALPHYEIAAFAQVVAKMGLEGDAVAQRILREAGEVLAVSALAVMERLRMKGKRVKVATTGSVLLNDRLVREAFVAAMRAQAPSAEIITPRYDAAVGAALLALRSWQKKCDKS